MANKRPLAAAVQRFSARRRCKRRFCGLAQAESTAVGQPIIGSEHLKVIRTSNPNSGARITMIGVERLGETETPKLASELRQVIRAANPDTMVLQFCEDRYKKQVKESGSEEIPLNLSGVFDMRHLANSVRMAVHLINAIARGPRFNYNMFAIDQLECRIVLGDIPMSVLTYNNEVGRSLKEAKDYISSVDRKKRRQAHYPGLIPLLGGLGSLQELHNWVYKNRKGILHKEKILTEFATELHNKRGINKSYFNETCYALAHAAYNAEGKNILVVCNHLALERVYLNLGKTDRETVRKLRKAPPKALQGARLISSWAFNWWNAFCAGMFAINYASTGFDPTTAALFLGFFPASYPVGWALFSLRARRRVQKFQQIIFAKRSQPRFEQSL